MRLNFFDLAQGTGAEFVVTNVERGFRSVLGGRSLRSRWSLALALGAGLTLSFVLPVQAAVTTDTLDQSQNLTIGAEQTPWMAQTFTAGMTGQLDRVSLASLTQAGLGTVIVQSVTGTFPAGTPLGTTALSGVWTGNKQFHDFWFTPAISIRAGSHYAIVVKMTGRSKLTWYDSGGWPAYTGGQLYTGGPSSPWATDPVAGAEFAFRTYVIGGSANQAPVVAADSSTVTVNEGTAPAMTGTFSDPDGDTVSLTASAGTVTQTGTNAGTWSWTQPATDEPSSQSVTIKADDGRGLTSTAFFAATTIGVAPTVSISRATVGLSASAVSTSAPASSPEGTAINLNGSASSPSAADNAAGFTYSWNVTKDGASYGTGSAAGFSFTPNDEGTYVATLQATDDGAMTGTSSVTFIGTNVAPTAKITSVAWTPQLVLTAHQSVSFAGSFTDPGTLDTHTAGWKFGDGATSTGFSVAHAYNAPGVYTVTFTVTDDDNGTGQATTTVTVQTPQQALTSIGGYVQNLKGLNGGQKNSLMAKLNAAGDSMTRGNATAANNQLNAFLNELQADLNTGRISAADMTTLRDSVHAVQAALGTYNRFLEWWPLGA
jgi:PKD repeat protein